MARDEQYAYYTESVMVGGTKIKVRQRMRHVIFKLGTGNAANDVGAAVTTARVWLQRAIQPTASLPYLQQITPIFKFFFRDMPDENNLTLVLSILRTIQTGLQQPFAIKISDHNPNQMGRVNQHGMFVQPSPDKLCKYQYIELETPGQHAWVVKGEIHINRACLNDTQAAASTLIHEAGHKFSSLLDFHSFAYPYDLTNYNLPTEECYRNADTYSAFVHHLNSPAAGAKNTVTCCYPCNACPSMARLDRAEILLH